MGFNITVTAKGQMTIPKHVRDALNVRPGDKCYAWVRNGEMIVVPRNKPLSELAGFMGKPPSEREATVEQIDAAIEEEAVERYANSGRPG
ncbi:AbrB/MazE/SpoVT family DNA-binding domain-containing protein [Ciceribacter selenitireducens]|nr:AbrB/MazE/SpoVT family DNA-binding domain-containing protein [Ciceribacter selenitireducens]